MVRAPGQCSFLTGYRRHGAATLWRYSMGGRKWFAEVRPLCVSLDASRVGGKDLLSAVLLGSYSGRHKAM